MKMPPQRSKLIFEGRTAVQFWTRAFRLEAEIDNVIHILNLKPERMTAAVPIIAEYRVDERMNFIFLIQAVIDGLGIQDGSGVVYCASPEYEKDAFEARDRLANDLLREMERQGKFDEVIQIRPGKET